MRFRMVWRLAVLLAIATCGCSRQENYDRYIPPADAARVAVEAALTDWQQGKPAGEIARLKPVAHLVDTHRTAGQTLKSFEILGESPAAGVRCFSVQVQLDHPPEETRLRFYVVGIDPLWIFRQEDYDMLAHWDCKMPEEEPAEVKTEADTESAAPEVEITARPEGD